ncbi:putative multiple C2 and transmembrane domain-containing protein [Sesbania bispinosa]|nr:putative multiple C2 and transmembrane domain-containing protein [Sesbania bispinosa]
MKEGCSLQVGGGHRWSSQAGRRLQADGGRRRTLLGGGRSSQKTLRLTARAYLLTAARRLTATRRQTVTTEVGGGQDLDSRVSL